MDLYQQVQYVLLDEVFNRKDPKWNCSILLIEYKMTYINACNSIPECIDIIWNLKQREKINKHKIEAANERLKALQLKDAMQYRSDRLSHEHDSDSVNPLGNCFGCQDASKVLKTVEQCNHIMKLAKAKLNDGNIVGARNLYNKSLYGIWVWNRGGAYNCKNCESRYSTMRARTLASLYFYRGFTYHYEKDYQKCLSDYNLSLLWNPDSERTYICKWKVLSVTGRYAEALACLEEGQIQLKQSKELAIRQRRKEKPPYLNKKDWVVYDSVLGVCSLEEAEQYDKRQLGSIRRSIRAMERRPLSLD